MSITTILQSQTSRILAPLNDQQRIAVTHGVGPLLVLAGAGSGKTRVLTHRIAYLIEVQGVSPYDILAVTFTNKAAREMKERVMALAGPPGASVMLGTFHSTCVRILRREAALFQWPNFSIYDTDDQRAVVRQAMEAEQISESRFKPMAVLAAISDAKNELIGPNDYRDGDYFQEVVRRVYPRYQELLKLNSAFDFDDLIMETVRHLRANPDRLEHYAGRFRHVLVDEYQDTNHAQYVLVNLLGSKHRNIFVVGDDDQSVYSWRGADIRNILELERDYPEVSEVKLEQNYRSTQNILDAAHGVIVRNVGRKSKKLWTEKEGGAFVIHHQASDESTEARFVTDQIRQMVEHRVAELQECAVLYRTNAQSRALEEAFILAGLPYVLVGGTRFYERREVKDILAYLRLLDNPLDGVTLRRVINVPPRKIGSTTIDTLRNWAKQHESPLMVAVQRAAQIEDLGVGAKKAVEEFARMIDNLQTAADSMSVTALLDEVVLRTGYEQYIRDGSDEGEERWANVLELWSVASQYADEDPHEGLRLFLESVALLGETDEIEEDKPRVTLLTMHSAKGLEYRVIFIVGMEENLFPHARSQNDERQMEEERRLCYVGITRAKERVYLVRAARRLIYGNTSTNPPSRFLLDIPEHLWDSQSSPPRAGMFHRPAFHSSAVNLWTEYDEGPAKPVAQIFQSGDRVRHTIFGTGTVLNSTVTDNDQEVEVEFTSIKGPVVKKLAVSFARLEHL